MDPSFASPNPYVKICIISHKTICSSSLAIRRLTTLNSILPSGIDPNKIPLQLKLVMCVCRDSEEMPVYFYLCFVLQMR